MGNELLCRLMTARDVARGMSDGIGGDCIGSVVIFVFDVYSFQVG